MLAKLKVADGSDVWADGSMDVSEAERFTGLGRTSLLSLAYAGVIPSVRVGRRRLFSRAGLIDLLRKGTEKTTK